MVDYDLCLEQMREEINSALELDLATVNEYAAVAQAMRYSVFAGGKRLRPVLTLAVAETMGLKSETVMKVACSVEYIHTYSLIHDDLPAMDNSKLRRGKPSCHCVFGEATAILAGDALLTLAFERIAGFGLEPGRERAALLICNELTTASGVAGIIGGQALDLQAEGRSLNPDELERICALKTGALIKAAACSGALASGASAAELTAISGYASCLGLAFQIVDDLLDREGVVEDLGKVPGTDRSMSKATYPAIMGDSAARQRAEALYRQSLICLEPLERPTGILSRLASRLVYRTC